MPVTLDVLVKETKAAFIIAKGDGVLDVSEVIHIAVELAQKIQKLASLSGSEKKSVLLLTLKKGLESSGGVGSLPGFANASPEDKAAFETSLLNSASVAIDALVLAANGKLDLRKPSSWLACLPSCLATVDALIPKDQVLLKEAVDYAEKFVNKDAVVPDVAASAEAAVETKVSEVLAAVPTLPGATGEK
jgi:hypothetical protein